MTTAPSFAKDIRPIFEGSCWTCHGDTAQLSKFDLRTRDSALKGGEHGSDIVPGNADQSRMYRRVAGLEKPSMPAQGAPLSADPALGLVDWLGAGPAAPTDALDRLLVDVAPGVRLLPHGGRDRPDTAALIVSNR